MSRATVTSPDAPRALGPYSQAQLLQWGASRLCFASGQVGLEPQSGELREGVAEQTRQALANLEAVLAAAGLGLRHVVKTTVFLVDMADFDAMNEAYGRAFADGVPPARSTVAVAGLPKGARVEIEAIAAQPGF